MKTRELLRKLHKAGCTEVRQGGSHKTLRTAAGKLIVIPFSGSHLEVQPWLLSKLRKAVPQLEG